MKWIEKNRAWVSPVLTVLLIPLVHCQTTKSEIPRPATKNTPKISSIVLIKYELMREVICYGVLWMQARIIWDLARGSETGEERVPQRPMKWYQPTLKVWRGSHTENHRILRGIHHEIDEFKINYLPVWINATAMVWDQTAAERNSVFNWELA